MDDGRVIDDVQTSLESEGYALQSFVIPACAVEAVHRRDRVWIVANRNKGDVSERSQTRIEKNREKKGAGLDNRITRFGNIGDAPHPQQIPGGEKQHATTEPKRPEQYSRVGDPRELLRLTESPVCGADDGLPSGMDKPRHRKRRLEGLGNAIVPQVAYEIFKAIEFVNQSEK
jgi:DNA (cytosine-5)-methyltransferase 1